jgi:glucose-1-phosphate thymidylyltransferase
VGDVPLLEYHLRPLHSLGFRRAICVIGYLGDRIKEFVSEHHDFGLEMTYAVQSPSKGTGAALLSANKLLKADRLAVIYADTFFPDLVHIWQSALASDRAKMVCASVGNAGTFGRVETYEESGTRFLKRIVEKDGIPTPGLVNAGLYILPRAVMPLLENVKPSKRGEIELTEAVEGLVGAGHPVEVLTAPRWVDVGTMESLGKAEALAKEKDGQ